MTTPEIGDIPFSASHTQQAFKLLELPPELLALLEGENPPILNIYPNPSLNSSGHALLSTPDKSLTYHIRQKNTSNVIHLLTPGICTTTTGIIDDGAGEMDEKDEKTDEMEVDEKGKEVLGIHSIAMIEDTLELYVVAKEEESTMGAEKVGGKVNKWHEKFAKGRGR